MQTKIRQQNWELKKSDKAAARKLINGGPGVLVDEGQGRLRLGANIRRGCRASPNKS